jgi:hypothetical protein
VPTHRKIGELVGRMSRSWNFSREVNDTFAGAKDLDRSTAAHLDEDLTRSPSNRTARLTLPAYSRTASDLDALQIRLRQLLWFASNQPKHEVLAGPFASPDPRVLPARMSISKSAGLAETSCGRAEGSGAVKSLVEFSPLLGSGCG